MFSLTISGATLDEFNAAITAFAAGGAVSGKTTKKVVVAPAAPAAAPAVVAQAPAPQQQQAAEKQAAVEALAPAKQEGPTAAELEQEVRALLTPLLRDPDQAPKVADLMAKFGATKLSKIPADKMVEVLAEGKVLAAAAAKVPA